jgi:hypothetical protein
MNNSMKFEVIFLGETFPADVTHVRALAGVNSLMNGQIGTGPDISSTVSALKLSSKLRLELMQTLKKDNSIFK